MDRPLCTMVRWNKCKKSCSDTFSFLWLTPQTSSDVNGRNELYLFVDSLTDNNKSTMEWVKRHFPIFKVFFPNCLNNHSTKIYVRSTITGQGRPCEKQIYRDKSITLTLVELSIYKGRQHATTEVHKIIPKCYGLVGPSGGRNLDSRLENGGLQGRAGSVEHWKNMRTTWEGL